MITRIPQGERDAAVARVLAVFAAFPDAPITGYERHTLRVRPLDEDDRHVAAAAYAARVDVLVTGNTRHFPPETFAAVRHAPEVLTPDAFAARLFAADPERLLQRLRVQVTARQLRVPDETLVTHLPYS